MAGTRLTIQITKNIPTGRRQIKDFRKAVKTDLTPVADQHVARRKEVVANFKAKNRPDFSSKITFGRGVKMTISATGARFAVLLWKWLDKTGTKRHPIAARRKPFLIFNWGGKGSYKAKTLPNPPRFGGLGKVIGGRIRKFEEVDHPGFPPRKFGEKINKLMRPLELAAIFTGGVKGLRIAKGKGKVKK